MLLFIRFFTNSQLLAGMALLCLATAAAAAADSSVAAQTVNRQPAATDSPAETASKADLPAVDSGNEAPGLVDCPGTPNCVSSLASDAERRVEPLRAGSDADSAYQRLTAVLDSLPRVSWQAPSAQRINAEFTSRLLRFVDDVNFVIRPDGLVEVRSASRIGYSDLGANRKRVKMLREALKPHAEQPDSP